MYCNQCGQDKASVHYSQMEFGECKELHLCESCSQEQSMLLGQKFSVSDFLAGFSGVESTPASTLQCSTCGLTYDDFCETGRFGCSDCFDAFEKQVDDLLKSIHGSHLHSGKVPHNLKKKTLPINVSGLKKQLAKAIKMENYEEAAKLRDQIKDVEFS